MTRTKIEKAMLAQIEEERENQGNDSLITLSVLTGRLWYQGAITSKTADRIQKSIDQAMEELDG